MRALVNYQTNPLQRTIVFCVNKCWLLFATLIILIAVVFTLLRVFLPEINYFKSDIEQWLEQQYAIKISIDRIDAEWGESGPIVSLSNLQLKPEDQDENLVQVGSLMLHIDGITSLLTGRLATKNIEVEGANLQFILDRKLGVRFERPDDAQSAEIEAASQSLLNHLFSQKNVTLIHSNIQLETLNNRQFNYWIRRLDITNFNEIHQLTGVLENEFGGQLKLVAEIYEEPWLPESKTHLYLEGKNWILSQLPGFENMPQMRPAEGSAEFRLWGDWQNGRWDSAMGDFQLEDVAWSKSPGVANSSEPLSQLSASEQKIELVNVSFKWSFIEDEEGILVLHNLKLKEKNQLETVLPPINMLYRQTSKYGVRWDVVVNRLQIAPLLRFIAIPLPSESSSARFLRDSGFAMTMDKVGFRLSKLKGIWAAPTGIVHFSQINGSVDEEFPSISGVGGTILMVNQTGQLKLQGENSTVNIQPLFRNPLQFEQFELVTDWTTNTTGELSLSIKKAYFENSAIAINAKAAYFTQDEEPNFSLFAELSNVDVSQKSTYLPSGIMSPDLTSYLDTSIRSGTLSTVTAAVRGPLKSFPFSNQDGIFVILGQLEDATYRYLPDWPVAAKLNAKLLFEGNGMDLRADGGTSDKIMVNSARAIIRDFSATNTPFELSIDAVNTNNHGRDFLTKTPLKNIAQTLESLDYEGAAQVKLSMKLGLDDASNLALRGEVIPDSKKAAVSYDGLKFEKLNGVLKFNERGILLSQIEASYFDHLLLADLEGGQTDEQPTLALKVSGLVSAEAIENYLQVPDSGLLEGETEMVTQVIIGPVSNPDQVSLKIDSQLEGMTVHLPDELYKDAKSQSPFSLLLTSEASTSIELNWKDFKAKWWWDEVDEQYNHIGGTFLYASDRELPEEIRETYSAHINLSSFTPEAWSSVFEKIETFDSAEENILLPDIEVAVNLESVENDHIIIEKLAILGEKKQSEAWRFFADSPFGKFSLSQAKEQPWQLKISNLDLQLVDSDQSTEEQSKDADGADDSGTNVNTNFSDTTNTTDTTNSNNPEKVVSELSLQENSVSTLEHSLEMNTKGSEEQLAIENSLTEISDLESVQADLNGDTVKEKITEDTTQFPHDMEDVTIQCENCKIGGVEIGDFTAQLRNEENRLNVFGRANYANRDQIDFDFEWITFTSPEPNQPEVIEGEPNRPVKTLHQTKLDFNLATTDVGKLLNRLDYPVVVKESRGRIVGTLDWMGTPTEFDPTTANGVANFQLGEGYLSEVSDARARLFSVLSLQTLSRRLKLDFKDVYEKGFFYDKLTGAITLGNGFLESHNVYLDGSAAKVTLDGAIDLAEQSIEQHASVVPQLTSSLPVLIGWAVEPTTGILVFLLNKIFEPAIEVVTQIEYRIHGSLEDIKVDEVKRAKSSVKYTVPEDLLPPESQSDETGIGENKKDSEPETEQEQMPESEPETEPETETDQNHRNRLSV